MKRSVLSSQFLGFIFVSVFGTFLHFVYEWSGENIIAALFSAVNESTWEHMKLLFFSAFAYSLIQYKSIGKEYGNYWCIKLKGISLGLILIPVLFYTCNGAFGKSPDWVNISIFFISAAIACIFETKLFIRSNFDAPKRKGCLAVLCLIGVLFLLFTFIQPHIPLFMDPSTLLYGR